MDNDKANAYQTKEKLKLVDISKNERFLFAYKKSLVNFGFDQAAYKVFKNTRLDIRKFKLETTGCYRNFLKAQMIFNIL